MRRLSRCLALVCLPVAMSVLADPREGKWEYTSEMKIPGMQMPQMPAGVQLPPGMTMPQVGAGGGLKSTFQQCLTKEDMVPRSGRNADDCKITKQDRKGNTITWAATCTTAEGTMQGEGTATYTDTTMTSTMNLAGTSRGQPVQMQQTMTGKYLGACDSK